MCLKKWLIRSGNQKQDWAWAKNRRKGSRPTLRTGEKLLGLRQPHPEQQVGVAWVGTQPIPVHVYCKPRHCGGMLCVTFFEQPERLVFVAETRINSAKRIKIDVSARG